LDANANPALWLTLVALGSYLLGSIPFGVLITRAAGVGDVRKIGSGNIGATNVLRTGRKDLALTTLLLDGGKGALAVLLVRFGLADLDDPARYEAVAGGAAFLGHLYPVWLKFKGGKGVATFYGTMLAAWWPAGLLAALAWISMAVLFRISSLAALTAAALSPFFVLATDGPHAFLLMAIFMAVLIFVRHRENIARLLRGEEPRIGGKKTPPPDPTAST
jgi:glycerol-3-phosphate acyltransferase PlsY